MKKALHSRYGLCPTYSHQRATFSPMHPSHAQAQLASQGKKGKEECWIISDAEPGSVIALGFDSRLSEEEMRAATLDGSIMNLLSWHDVSTGDVFHIPPGTVHAIGGGISLLEVQQIPTSLTVCSIIAVHVNCSWTKQWA